MEELVFEAGFLEGGFESVVFRCNGGVCGFERGEPRFQFLDVALFAFAEGALRGAVLLFSALLMVLGIGGGFFGVVR